MTLNDFIQGWDNQNITPVELIAHYAAECYGVELTKPENVLDYWNTPDEASLTLFSRVGGSGVQVGDVAVLEDGMAIVYSLNGDVIQVLSANTDTARIHEVHRGKIDGILRPHLAMLPTVVAAPASLDTPDNPPLPTPTPLPPKGAERAPSPRYTTVKVSLPAYITPGAAISGKNPITFISPGDNYYLFTTKSGMDNVTTTSSVPGVWINPADNVAPPEPEPIPTAIEPSELEKLKEHRRIERDRIMAMRRDMFAPEWQKTEHVWNTPRKYVAQRTVALKDLEGNRYDLPKLLEGKANFFSSRVEKDGITYIRLAQAAANSVWYCVPFFASNGSANFISEAKWQEQQRADAEAWESAQREAEAIEIDNRTVTVSERLLLAMEHVGHKLKQIVRR